MKLNGIDFGYVFQSSGSTNFYGQGWWYHKFLKWFGLNFSETTFVSKTTTLNPRVGNMPLKDDGVTPKELRPKCIHRNSKTGAAVNAVGLSGPGLQFLLDSGKWQKRTNPFFISLMSMASTSLERQKEIAACVELLMKAKKEFCAPFGIQANFSCPNGGLNPNDLIDEVIPNLEILEQLGVPLMPKFGPNISVEAAIKISEHPACNAICVFNTLPWDEMPEEERMCYFGTTVSPLTKHFGENVKGGVSGRPLKNRLLKWVRQAKREGLQVPINAGGGILSPQDARDVIDTGADSVFLGSIAFLAPTQVATTAFSAWRYLKQKSDAIKNQHSTR